MSDTAADQQRAALDRDIAATKESFLKNEEARKSALACGDSWKAGQYNVAAARDRERLRVLVQQKASSTPADKLEGHSSQVFTGSPF